MEKFHPSDNIFPPPTSGEMGRIYFMVQSRFHRFNGAYVVTSFKIFNCSCTIYTIRCNKTKSESCILLKRDIEVKI
jgi:hypothetical protein